MRRFLAGALLALTTMVAHAEAGRVVLVRHAEKASDGTVDPPLSEAGRRRAEVLAERLAGVPVGAILVTEYRRTRQTAEPLARRLGLSPRMIGANDLEAVVAAVRSLPADKVAVVIGHGNSVPQVVHALGGPVMYDFGENEYDRFLELYLETPPRLVQSRYP